MTFLKRVFGKSNKNQSITNCMLVSMWWWGHNAHCGKIMMQPETIINNDNLLVIFVNDFGEQWFHTIVIDGKPLTSIEIDYTKLMNTDHQIFSGKVNKVIVNWKHLQQQFIAKSNFLMSTEEDLWEFEAK